MSVATSLLPQPAILVALAHKSLSLAPLITSYAVFFLSLGTSIVLYRISPFHPLAGIPGPFLARVTKLWTFYTTTTGELARAMKKLHDEYGPVVRTGTCRVNVCTAGNREVLSFIIGPNEISIIDGDAVTAVYGTNGIPKGKCACSIHLDLGVEHTQNIYYFCFQSIPSEPTLILLPICFSLPVKSTSVGESVGTERLESNL